MKSGLAILMGTVFLIGCNKNGSNEDFEELKGKFQGKYEIISSISENSVDLNMDGTASTDLLSENDEISRSGLEIRVISDDKQLFEEIWPVEHITIPYGETLDSTSFHPDYFITYGLYINPSLCKIDMNSKSIDLLGYIAQNSTNTLLKIESIAIGENDVIQVTTVRKLFTMRGWIITRIESKYKRYTTIT